MNTNLDLSRVPPQIPAGPSAAVAPVPLGDHPQDREPLAGPSAAVEAVLRQPRRLMYQLRQPGSRRLVLAMLLVSVVSCLVYGLVLGSFSMESQLWAAPLKLSGGLLAAALLCFPSLYIFTCLSGSEAKLGEIAGLAAGLLMLTSLLLIGFAPVAWLFAQSTNSLVWMGVLHLLFWFIALIFGFRFLRAGFLHSRARSTVGLYAWVGIFLLVTLQMTTSLRPTLGKSDTFLPEQKMFFLSHWGDCLKAGR
jgi:hypothetical protein